MLVRQNDTERAIELLLQLHPPEDRESPADLLLAKLYRRINLLPKAEAICKRVLNETPTASAIEFTADLLGSQGQTCVHPRRLHAQRASTLHRQVV